MLYCPTAKAGVRRPLANEGLRELAFGFEFEGAKVLVNVRLTVKIPDVSEPRRYFEEVKRMLDVLEDQVELFVEELYRGYEDDRTVFVFGNGGSAANASHFAQDLAMRTASHGRRFRAIALTENVPLLTALANDEGYENVFVEQLKTFARPGDVILAISGSGNSPNVLKAVAYADEQGMRTIGITGFDGGRLGECAKLQINVPSRDIGLVEAVHSVLFHLTVSRLRARIAG